MVGSGVVGAGALTQIAEWPVPHAAAAVIGPNGVVATFGDLARRYPLASVTKPLAAVTALVAVEEEAIDLDDPVAIAVTSGATVRHLFSHASGLSMDRAVRAAEPGTRRIYSNYGIDLLAETVAAATGISFEAYFQEAVAGPLQLTSTNLGKHASRDGISSVADLGRVVAELLSPTGLLHPSTLAEMASVQFPGLRGVLPGFGPQVTNDWGLGFEIKDHKTPHWTGSQNSPATFGHFGQSGTFLWVDPVAWVGLVALTDRNFDQWAIDAWPALSDAVLAEFATSPPASGSS
ncbi:MAG: beta-lactamase [Pseudonocardiales bacterium]|nr:beta-lactamase [Pseudonocardiales bacterium]